MIENKLVKMVMFFLSSGEQPKWKVSNKIKNYPVEMKAEAIKFLLSGRFITIREDRSEKSGRGRSPSYISLTEKGVEKLSGYSEKPEHESIWNI
jgi:hypothetical protein